MLGATRPPLFYRSFYRLKDRSDGGALAAAIRYGLAASIEVAQNVQIDVHGEVRSRLRQEVRARARV